MRIYLVRHGLARERSAVAEEDDAQRPLTDPGRRKLAQTARALLGLKVRPDLIVSSPYLRARQTAELMAKALKYKPNDLEFSDRLLPDGQPGSIIGEIIDKYLVEDLMLVGHEPCLGILISALTTGGGDLAVHVRCGSVCCLSADDFRLERRATLEWLLTPKMAARVRS